MKNKDVSLRAIVLSLSILMFVFCSSHVLSQPAPSTKSNPTVKSAPSAAEAALIDDNEEESATNDKDDVEEIAEEYSEETSKELSEAKDSEDVEAPPEKQVQSQPAEPARDDSEEPTSEASAQQDQIPENEQEVVADSAGEEAQDKPTETVAKDPVVEKNPEPIPEPPLPETVLSAENTTEADYVEVIPMEKSVELVTRKSYTAYRDRRTTHGFLFNLGAENLYFPEYASIQDGKLYEELFGQEDLTLVQMSVSYKLNFFLGSLAAGIGYGQGTLIDDRSLNIEKQNEERSLTIEKKSFHGQLIFDSLMKEPYFVPYVGLNYWQLGISEKNTKKDKSSSRNTGFGTSMTIGFLMQMNWIEPETSKMAYLSHGLENTYLDIFWTQYQGTGEDDDPNFENDFNFGVGLKLEY